MKFFSPQTRVLRLLVFCFYLGLFFSGCVGRPTQMSGPSLNLSLMLTNKDLPPHWEFLGGSYPDVENAGPSRQVAYVPDEHRDNAINISHQIAMYSDPAQAETEFLKWETQWFNSAWSPPENLTFQPSDAMDKYRLECMDLLINDRPATSCTYLQQHGKYIIKVLVNLDYQTMNFTQLEEVLQKLDIRLNELTAEN